MNKVFHLLTLWGVPIGVTPWFFILIAILAFSTGSTENAIIFAVVAIIALLVHEMGHALVAARYHLDPQVIFGGLGGLTQHKSANAKQSFRITLAGPLSGLVLALIFFGIYLVLSLYAGTFLQEHIYFSNFLLYMFTVNGVWSIFNLLPIYPMDGGKLTAAILAKFFKPQKAIKIGLVISMVFCVALVGYAIMQQAMFMIFIASYMLLINGMGVMKAFQSIETRRKEEVGMLADTLSELAMNAAREHRWKELEMYGHRMKEAAVTKAQTERAYEFLTIACTNTFKYKEALDYSERAAQSEPVRQAVERCHRMLNSQETK